MTTTGPCDVEATLRLARRRLDEGDILGAADLVEDATRLAAITGARNEPACLELIDALAVGFRSACQATSVEHEELSFSRRAHAAYGLLQHGAR